MNAIDQARQMMVMASKDIKAMKSLLLPESADDEIFGFHAQQAVEKSLKAWIAVVGGSYGFVHDIHVLLLNLRELGCDISRFKSLLLLNVYAVRFRYEPQETPTNVLDRIEMLCKVVELYDHVLLAVSITAEKSVDY
jgi:HEPN domain-containing protein